MRGFALILVISLSTSLVGQPILRLKSLTTKEGLSQNSINDLLQASDGRLWIATQDGLNSFDGRSFKLYGAGSDAGVDLSDNFVWGLYEDPSGNIWAASRNGINRVNTSTGLVTTFIQQYDVDDMASMWGNNGRFTVVHNGYVHIGFVDHMYRFKVGAYATDTVVALKENQVWLPELDSFYVVDALVYHEELYLRTSTGVVRVTSTGIETLSLPMPVTCVSQPNAFYVDNDDRLWLGGENGVLWYHGTEWNQLRINGESIRSVHSVVQDLDGNIWIGTTNGVHVFDKELRYKFHSRTNVDKGEEETYDLVHSMEVCSDGTVWLGTANTGLKSHHWSKEQFKFLRSPVLRSSNLVWSSEIVYGNKLIVGTNNGVEFFSIDTTGLVEHAYKNAVLSENLQPWVEPWMGSIPKTRVLSIATDNSILYLGTAGDGLIRINRNTNNVEQKRFGTSYQNTISEVVVDKGKVWCATQAGLYTLDSNGEVQEEYLLNRTNWDGPAVYFISAYNDQKGNIWLGTNYGFSRFISETEKFEHYLHVKEELENGPAFNFVSGFARSGNDLWIATYGGGLSHMDINSGKFTHYGRKEGLANNVCSGIQMDKKGRLWLFNNGGISRFDPATEKFRNYDIGEGLIDNEFTLNSPSMAPNGLIYAGTPSGLVLFNPLNIQTQETVGKVQLTGLQVNYESIDVSNTIDLYRGDKSITLDISVLQFFNREGVAIKYRLVGYDDDWIESGKDHVRATYTSLGAGTYILEAVAFNKDHVNGERTVLATIEVHPPFWQTWWFILLVALGALVTVILTVRYFAQRKLQAKLDEIRVQKKLQEERNRISRDLHDNVGAQLTYIISSLDNAAVVTGRNDQETGQKLDALSDFSRNTMQQLRESIWVINSETITIKEFSQRITGLGAKLIPEGSDIQFSVNAESIDGTLNPSKAIHLLRIVQESVNNAVKHSQCQYISIHIQLNGGGLDLSITDDGVGTDEVDGKEGHYGLPNIRERAVLIDATAEIISSKDRGLEVRVSGVALDKGNTANDL